MDHRQEPVSLDIAPTVVDKELEAPGIPTTQDLGEQPTADLVPDWEDSSESLASPGLAVHDESPALRRKLRWVTIALAASIAAHVGGLIGEYVLPAIVARVRSEELIYHRVWKSARSIEAARRLGDAVPPEIEQLQREAERAVFAGDVTLAAEKLDQVNRGRR